jgi:uncharacterized membrane protein YoaT (DUF817 family)
MGMEKSKGLLLPSTIDRFFAPGISCSPFKNFLLEFLAFGVKNALSCLFPAFIFFLLAVSNVLRVPHIPRYDLLLMACIGMQAAMYFTKLETRDEILVITLFHLLGLGMEIFKVHKGSWSYPEFAYTKVYGVPLYSGFMYASVASFVCQAWRWFGLKFTQWPNKILAVVLGSFLYLNCFTHPYIFDMRWVITGRMCIVFFKTKVEFNCNGTVRKMPMVITFFLIGLFIWIAENIATFFNAWKYSYQHKDWHIVSYGKISSWFMLVIVSVIIVVELKFFKEKLQRKA